MFNKKSLYSKYCNNLQIKYEVFKKVFGDDVPLGSLKIHIQYHFETDIFGNETLIIYSNRPGLIIGKNGETINKLKEAYTSLNTKCKTVKVYETNYMGLN